MPSAPKAASRPAPSAAQLLPLEPLEPLLPLDDGPDAAIAPIILGTATEPAAPELSLSPDPPPPAVPTVSAAPVATIAMAAAAVAPSTAAPPIAAPFAAVRPAVATLPAAPAAAAPAAVSAASVPAAKRAPAAIAVTTAPAAAPATAPVAAAPLTVAAPAMDRDFIARNQIVERYISGRLPIKGATDFEKFCTENPALLDELGLPERVNAGLRLLEAAGKPEPWQETPKRFWEKPHVAIGLGAAALTLLISLTVVWSGSSDKSARIAKLEKRASEQPLDPATSTRTIRLLPSYKGGTNTPAVIVGAAGTTQLADLKLDLSRSAYRSFRITIDRIDQGRVAILHNVAKDSNGHVRIALNTSALGPGNYQLTLEGLTWKGETVPDAWLTIGIAH